MSTKPLGIKVGDFILGRTPSNALVAGQVISIDEARGLVQVGAWHQNSNSAVLDSCKDAEKLVSLPGVGGPPLGKPPTAPPPK